MSSSNSTYVAFNRFKFNQYNIIEHNCINNTFLDNIEEEIIDIRNIEYDIKDNKDSLLLDFTILLLLNIIIFWIVFFLYFKISKHINTFRVTSSDKNVG